MARSVSVAVTRLVRSGLAAPHMPEILAGDNLRECSGTGYRTNVIGLRLSPSGYRTDRESQSGAPGIW